MPEASELRRLADSREEKVDLTIFEGELVAFGDECDIYSVENNLWKTGIIPRLEGVECDNNQVRLINVNGTLYIFVKVKHFWETCEIYIFA